MIIKNKRKIKNIIIDNDIYINETIYLFSHLIIFNAVLLVLQICIKNL